jgi:hypothetical protein
MLEIKLKITTLLLAFTCAALFAETTPVDTATCKKDAGHTGFLIVGGGMRNVEDANEALQAQALPGLSKYYAAVGFGGKTRFKRLIGTSEFLGAFSNRWESADKISALYSATGTLNIGFDLVNSERIDLYPLLGVGGGILNLYVRDKEKTFAQFSPGASTPINMYQSTLLLNAGLGFDLISPMKFDGKSRSVGLRIGYMFDPTTKSAWQQNGTKVTNGPAPDLSGLYVKLILGSSGHGHAKKHECKGDCENKEPGPHQEKE